MLKVKDILNLHYKSIIICFGVFISAIILYFCLQPNDDVVILIKPKTTPIRVKPAQNEVLVPHQDKEIYQNLNSASTPLNLKERLVHRAELPIDSFVDAKQKEDSPVQSEGNQTPNTDNLEDHSNSDDKIAEILEECNPQNPAKGTKAFTLQIATCQSEQIALIEKERIGVIIKQIDELKKQPLTIKKLKTETGFIYRILFGQFATKLEAQNCLNKLTKHSNLKPFILNAVN